MLSSNQVSSLQLFSVSITSMPKCKPLIPRIRGLSTCFFLINLSFLDFVDGAEHLNESCQAYDMKISVNKTEVMSVSRRPTKLDVTSNQTQLKQVREFKYLGSVFTEDGKIDREIETRCQKANAVSYQLAPLLKHPSIPINVKAKLINAIFYQH